ncbi:MAG: hypothetical protein IKO55_03225 [Kiritimatiellae bacterium]|nr:hypothetical protein [Kiritimatiellia bacterium]
MTVDGCHHSASTVDVGGIRVSDPVTLVDMVVTVDTSRHAELSWDDGDDWPSRLLLPPCTNLALRLRIPVAAPSSMSLSPACGATGLWRAALRAKWDGRRGLDIERTRVEAANAHEPIAPTITKMRIAGNLLRNGPKRGMMDAVSRIGRPLRLFTSCGRFVDRLCDSCGRVGDNSGACLQVLASSQDIHRIVNSGGCPNK